MNVLSLFDGLGGGRIALDRLGIEVENYYSSEIDKYAIQVANKNYADIIQLGDVRKLDHKKLPKIDLLIGGFPCQAFSAMGSRKGFDDDRGQLFYYTVQFLSLLKPKYFMFENVKMPKKFLPEINKGFGVEPVEIDSSFFSAQRRKRFYWTNIPVGKLPEHEHPENVIDILQPDHEIGEFIEYPRSYFKYGDAKSFFENNWRDKVFNYSSSGRGDKGVHGRFNYSKKALTLTAKGYGSRSTTAVMTGPETWRRLTMCEWERLMGLDENYTASVSNND
jgi:DNA-cytosine methyltransferase